MPGDKDDEAVKYCPLSFLSCRTRGGRRYALSRLPEAGGLGG